MTDKERIEKIIKDTFDVIQKVYHTQREGDGNHKDFCESQSRIIFPKYSEQYRDSETRISEQELRFIFVEQFNKYCENNSWNAYYSVETPTEEKYVFSKEHIKVVPYKADGKEKTGQSAMIDLSIHNDKFDRIALIEFKALNPEESAFAKDFCKLSNEPTCLTFFVMIVKNHDNGTITNIHKKIESKGAETEFYCFDLEKGEDISKKIIDGISSSENK
ncbi:hypothetical protein DW064_06280 [Segatella copri]|uniref:Uncharacterized protein n=1 Tax=Segatella copri TaxID=165179 RepID=A0AA92V8A9_9BACT|nr:hypothetical protein DW064_06280 [Segatella copri]